VKKGQLESTLLVLVTLGLVAFGLVMVYSATSAPAALGGGDPGYYLKRQSIYALIGLAVMLAASRLDFRALRTLSPILLGTAAFLCLAVLVVGESVNGAKRWLTVGPAVFQPSELAKLAIAVWAALYLSQRKAPRTLKEMARPLGVVAGSFGLLLMLEPDLGTTITLIVMLIGVLVVSGTPVRLVAASTGLVAGLALAAIWVEPYRRERFLSFLHPWSDQLGAGFQSVQAMIGLGSGGVFGKGLGRSPYQSESR
jgi:cell division protein FtsW